MSSSSKHPETIALHAGWRADPATGAVAVPIYQTTSYQFHSTEHAANLFALKELGNIYTRIMNPTNDVLEKRVAALEGGVGALALASGQAASAFAIENVARAGDNVVSSTDLYGGTWNLFANTMKDQGIEVRFVDPIDPHNFRKATDDRTRAYYAETLPNPKLTVFPIAEVADIGRNFGIPLIMDNTASPILTKPFEHGAAIVVYSTTKYMGGHGNSIGGLLVDSGTFDWAAHPVRQPALNTPDPSYHGAVWTQAAKPLGPIAYILKMRVTLLRDLGAPMSPFNAFLFIQGLETLPLRMRAHCANAVAVAKFLSEHPKVTRVIYPNQMTGEMRRRADAHLEGGYGGLVGFELKGGLDAGRRFIDALQMFYHVANIGDARSLAIHPATTTHSQLSPEEQLQTGVDENYVRLSIGIEHEEDILADLSHALEVA
jgi:O-acetylhomoserine (thiol)-lyase